MCMNISDHTHIVEDVYKQQNHSAESARMCNLFFFPSATAIPSRGENGCARRGSLQQDRLPVKFQDVKFQDPKFKHEIFMRIDMKHSYFSNCFILCLQSIFSVVNYN